MKSAFQFPSGLIILLVVSLILLQPVDYSPNTTVPSSRSPEGAQGGKDQETSWDKVLVSEPIDPTISPAARDLPAYEPEFLLDREINPRLSYNIVDPDFRIKGELDPLLALQANAPQAAPNAFLTPSINIPGQGFTSVSPPDTVGEVGPNHYVQMINSGGGTSVQIYDKSGTPQGSAWALDSLGSGNCASGHGDPIVLYDRIADRWLLGEFASAGNHLCVYISTSPDPAGAYYAYDFTTPNFPDYPKYAVWPDAYYVSSNESNPAVYALDRTQMLAGAAATSQRFSASPLSGFGFQALTPSDLDGATSPPAGAPNYFMRHRDDEVHNIGSNNPAADYLEIWEFHVDWATPANSTFAQAANLPITEFDSDLCGLTSYFCFPQPGTGNTLDPLREVVMWRLQYRNFGSHETLVSNLVTDVDGTDHGGIRWFELRKTGPGPWTLFQEGAYAPDAHHRWMGSAAMDSSGNIAVGYSVSSDTLYPSIRYAGRLAGAPLGTLPQSEGTIITGSSSQTSSTRWGDYSSLNVDPADDCTFWYTNEYVAGGQWTTQIAAFKFDACGTADFTLSASPAEQAICAPNNAVYDIQVGQVQSYTAPVTLSAFGHPAGTTATLADNPVTNPASTTLTISNTGSTAAGSYAISIVGIAPASTHTTTVQLDLFDSIPGAAALLAPTNHELGVSLTPNFSWTASPQGAEYHLEVATDNLFNNIIYSATVAGVSHPAGSDLDSNTVYYWRVTANNVCGTGSALATYTFTTQSLPGDCGMGTEPNILFSDDFESGAPGWSHAGTGDTWTLSSTRPHGGTYAYHATDVPSISDQQLNSPTVTLPTNQNPLTLQFWNYQWIEDRSGGCYDGGILELSSNGGADWTQLETELLTDPYDGPISSSWSNPLEGLNAWCGDPQDWLNSIVDLSAFAGQTVQFRFRLGADQSVGREGWHIDDVRVQTCQPIGPEASITLTKTVGTDPNECANSNTITVPAGTDVTYCYSIKNTSEFSLTHHTLVDDQLGAILSDIFYGLTPENTMWVTQTATITQNITNIATWTASAGDSCTAISTNTATVEVTDRTAIYLPLISNALATAPDLLVRQLTAGSNDVQVVVENQGSAATNTEFWVDVYLNPSSAPTAVNQLWWHLGAQGLAWGVTESLAPGETIILTFANSDPAYTSVIWPLALDTIVYAQVDSWNMTSNYGAVLENHEISGGIYNNISDPVYVNTGQAHQEEK